MPKRLTTKEVTEYIEKHGFSLNSDWEYKGIMKKLPLTCPKGHKTNTVTFNNFKHYGGRCPVCYGNAKFTTSDVKKKVEEEGYKLEEEFWEYKNSSEKVPMICFQGHKISMKWKSFVAGRRCKKCADESYKLKNKEVRDYITSEGYRLPTDWIYENSKLLIPTICPQGHVNDTLTWSNFKSGRRCKICNQKGLYNEVFFSSNPHKKNERAYFYWLELNINGKKWYEIGITIHLKSRLSKYSKFNYRILRKKEMILYNAWKLEQRFLKFYGKYRQSPLKFGGHTECFRSRI